MKSSNSLATALLFCLISLTYVVGQSAKSSESFNPSGSYHPVQPPEVISDKFLQFDLRVSRKSGTLRAVGEIRGVQPWLKFNTGAINEKGLRFLTDVKSGVRYEFEGQFLMKGNFALQWSGDQMIPIKGMWRKYVRGKQVWEYATGFIYYPPH